MSEVAVRPKEGVTSSRLKSVVIPNEHGGWGFVSQPLLLGLFLAPSAAGLWLTIATLGLFLTRHPLKIVIKDRSNGRVYARTRLAEQVVAASLLTAIIGAALAFKTAIAPFWPVLLMAAPFALVQFVYDANRRGREALPEIVGAIAIGAAGPAIALAAGWSLGPALALWVLIALHAATSILYIRARLRVERGKPADRQPIWGSHFFALAAVGVLAFVGLLPWLSVVAIGLMTARALLGLSSRRQPAAARTLGFREMGYSLALVLLTVVGYWLGI